MNAGDLGMQVRSICKVTRSPVSSTAVNNDGYKPRHCYVDCTPASVFAEFSRLIPRNIEMTVLYLPVGLSVEAVK